MMEDGTYNAMIARADLCNGRDMVYMEVELRLGRAVTVGYGEVCMDGGAGSAGLGVTLMSRLMDVADADRWSKVGGRPCRVVIEDGRAVRLMHFLDDDVVCDARELLTPRCEGW